MTALSSADPGRPIDWEMDSRVQAAQKAPGSNVPGRITSRRCCAIQPDQAQARGLTALTGPDQGGYGVRVAGLDQTGHVSGGR